MPERIHLADYVDANPGSPLLRNIMGMINSGDLFVYPTETIYGLGGIATDDVKEKLIQAKRRKPEHPFILIAGDRNLFDWYRPVFNRDAELLAKAFWPGPVTLIVRIDDTEKTVGLRVSDHPFIQKAAWYCKHPFFSTSANMSGELYVNDPDTIFEQFSDSIGFMIDEGVLPESACSTVVDVSRPDEVHVLREGAIPGDAIHMILDR